MRGSICTVCVDASDRKAISYVTLAHGRNGRFGGVVDTSHGHPESHPTVAAGEWVEVERVVLPAGQRAPNVPEDTAAVDFVARIRGFLEADGQLGADVAVRTLAGRSVRGRLRDVDPRNPADFGNPVAELLQVGAAARRSIEDERRGSR